MHIPQRVQNFAAHARKVVAIGRNYRLHAEELKNAVPSEPFWFLKPPSAFVLPVGTTPSSSGCCAWNVLGSGCS